MQDLMPVDHKAPQVFRSCWNRVQKSCVAYYTEWYVNSILIKLSLQTNSTRLRTQHLQIVQEGRGLGVSTVLCLYKLVLCRIALCNWSLRQSRTASRGSLI